MLWEIAPEEIRVKEDPGLARSALLLPERHGGVRHVLRHCSSERREVRDWPAEGAAPDDLLSWSGFLVEGNAGDAVELPPRALKHHAPACADE